MAEKGPWLAINYIIQLCDYYPSVGPYPVLLYARVVGYDPDDAGGKHYLRGLGAQNLFSGKYMAWPAEQPKSFFQQLHFPNSSSVPAELSPPTQLLERIPKSTPAASLWNKVESFNTHWCFRHDLLSRFQGGGARDTTARDTWARCGQCRREQRECSFLPFGLEAKQAFCPTCGQGGEDDESGFIAAAIGSAPTRG